MRNRIAICKYDESGKTDIVYAISNETETWAFSIQNDEGKIERPNEIRFKQVLDEIFIVEDIDVSVQKQIPQKFCTNCGFRLSTESKYCSNCGVSVL